MLKASRNVSARAVPLLMAASFVVLVGFCAQWVASQYEREKVRLQDDVARVFADAERETMDSLLLKNVLQPVLKEQYDSAAKANGKLRVIVLGDSQKIKRGLATVSFATERVEQLSQTRKKTVRMVMRSDSISTEIFNGTPSGDSAGRLLLRGAQLMVRQFRGDTTGTEFLQTPAAKQLLGRRFAAMSEAEKWGFNWRLVENSESVTDDDVLDAAGGFVAPQSRLEVRGYTPHLLRQIAPQIGFALLLITLTGGAFMLAWKSLRRQMQLNAMKNDFISNMSHELKTPVATVKVALEAIDRFRVSEDAQRTKEYLEMARLEMDRLELLVQQSLNTAMLESGKLSVANEVVDAKEAAEGLAKTLQPKLDAASSQLSVHIEGSQFNIVADRLHLQGVLMNLLDNALKYGGDGVQIQMKIREEIDAVVIEVEDNGPGIPAEYRSVVFDSYFRVPTGNRHNVKGYGLGLSYSRQAVERMGGNICVEECEGRGCRFVVRFPKAAA